MTLSHAQQQVVIDSLSQRVVDLESAKRASPRSKTRSTDKRKVKKAGRKASAKQIEVKDFAGNVVGYRDAAPPVRAAKKAGKKASKKGSKRVPKAKAPAKPANGRRRGNGDEVFVMGGKVVK